jgi:hypothetical protein
MDVLQEGLLHVSNYLITIVMEVNKIAVCALDRVYLHTRAA